jgi:hypothetical protein
MASTAMPGTDRPAAALEAAGADVVVPDALDRSAIDRSRRSQPDRHVTNAYEDAGGRIILGDPWFDHSAATTVTALHWRGPSSMCCGMSGRWAATLESGVSHA